MANIKLNLINRSADANNSDYVIFQKNAATDINIQSVAWKVVKNLGNSDNHPFVYPMEFQVCAKDYNGNYMPKITAHNDHVYEDGIWMRFDPFYEIGNGHCGTILIEG